MAKEKLTLYIDEKTSRMAHQVAASTGKSISELVREYTAQLYQQIESGSISQEVAKWIGTVKTRKSYRHLRDQITDQRLKRYESSR